MSQQYIVSSKSRIILFYAYLLAIGVLAFFLCRAIIAIHHTATQSKRGICALKAERVRRVEQTSDILAKPDDPDNSRIIALLGRAILLRSLATAKEDVTALKDVKC